MLVQLYILCKQLYSLTIISPHHSDSIRTRIPMYMYDDDMIGDSESYHENGIMVLKNYKRDKSVFYVPSRSLLQTMPNFHLYHYFFPIDKISVKSPFLQYFSIPIIHHLIGT